MQGQRSTIQSLPETFEFDLASSPNNSSMDQQLYWNNVLNPVDTRHMLDLMPSSSDTTSAFANTVSHHSGSFAGWNPIGPSSSGHALNQASHSEAKMEQGWMNPFSNQTRTGVRLGERHSEPNNILSLEGMNIDLNMNEVASVPLFQNSSSGDIPQNSQISASLVGNAGRVMEVGGFCHPYKPGGSETQQIPSVGGPTDPCAAPSGSAEHIVDNNDGRPGCSLDNRRLSCKRKALEGGGPSTLVGTCSLDNRRLSYKRKALEGGGPSTLVGTSNCFQRAESSIWHAVPAWQNAPSSSSSHAQHLSNVSPQNDLLNPRLDATRVAPDCHTELTGDGSAEGSQRNFRMRINPSHQQISSQSNLQLPGNTGRRSRVSSSNQSSSRVLLFNQPLDSRPAATNTHSPQTQSNAPHVPGFPCNMHPFPWDGVANSRAGSSLNSPAISGERTSAPRGEANSRSIQRGILEHSMFLPRTETRRLTQDPTNWSSTNGSVSIPGSTSIPGNTSSRGGSSSVVQPASTWVPHQNPPPRYPRRPSEAVRRLLFSSAISDSGASSSNIPPPRTAAASREIVLPPGAGHHGHHPSHLRSAFWMDRQGDSVLGVPLSLRALASASEGRSRLASELCNVLELVRRGESLRFEDVLILDQPVIFGVPDLHDRHRDMRLDVDNMSYEELLALEERIGNVSTGLSEETVLKCLKRRKYVSIAIEAAASEVEPCCICQEEYVEGEHLGTLDCGHDFHSNCIKQWLMHKNICPICKTTALVT